jgi:alpha-mannosidase
VGSALSIEGGHVTLPIHPYEILAVQVEYPHNN